MPKWTADDFDAALVGGAFGAISLDTNIFERASYNLDWPPLRNVRALPVVFLLTDVVVEETRKHIGKLAHEAAVALHAAAAKYADRWRVKDGAARIQEVVGVLDDHMGEAARQLEAYRRASDFEVLNASDYVDATAILTSYFTVAPPFEEKADKKHEFPDAFALHALEAWGERNQKYVLAVSHDKGWAAYADQSKWLVVRESLVKVLGQFNAKERDFARKLVQRANDGLAVQLRTSIDEAANEFVEELEPVFHAETAYAYDDELIASRLVERQPINLDTVEVIASVEGGLLVSLEVDVEIEVEASFEFFRIDHEGDKLPYGSAEAAKTLQISLPMTIAISRDEEDPDVVEIDVGGDSRIDVDFGSVEPDYADW